MNSHLSDKNPQEILKDIYKLNIKFRVLESNIEGYLGNGRNLSHDVLNKFLIEFRQNSKTRLNDCDKLRKRVSEIRTKINKFKISIANIQPNEEFVSSIKEVMEEIELLLTELKHEQKDKNNLLELEKDVRLKLKKIKNSYDNLLRSELALWQECVFMERKINAWDSGDNDKDVESLQKPSTTSIIANSKCENNAVIALQKFLDETGGKTGGWPTIDHQTFLRIRLKYTGINHNSEVCYPRDEEIFLSDLASLLAPKSPGDIKCHEIWFRKYQQLLSDKKKAIAEWKEQKHKQLNEVEVEIEEDPKSSSRSDWESQKKRLENQRKALDSWRAEKALEEYQRNSEKENALKQELERKKAEKERERKEMRQLVDEYKMKKKADEAIKREIEMEIIEQEREEKWKKVEMDTARINERNTRMIEGKIIKQHRKQFEDEQRQQRLNDLRKHISVSARRDPSRLLRPTSVWTQRLADTENSSESGALSSVTRLNNLQHKAIPSWRRDI